ncbi:MAG: YceD family protein [Methylococcales bacterium]|nr:YceD family protein [Methylococcales bacterium]MDD5754015.1 YceD family protein [Methylococcales bacterium]
MQNRLPEIIDPTHLADKRGELHGQILIKRLTRLTEKLVNDEGAVTVNLYFGRAGRTPKIDGNLKATLQLECQNCLQGIEFEINQEVKLGVVITFEQVERLSEELEPLLLEDETIPLITLVEDELLLHLPDCPKHTHDCMAGKAIKKHIVAFDEEAAIKKPNPFSVLAHLKSTGES